MRAMPLVYLLATSLFEAHAPSWDILLATRLRAFLWGQASLAEGDPGRLSNMLSAVRFFNARAFYQCG